MSFMFKGHQYRRSTSTNDKELAKRILAKIEGQIAEQKWFPEQPEQQKYTFSELADKYEAFIDGRDKSDMKRYIIPQLREHFAGVDISDIDVQAVELFQSKRLKAGRRTKQVKAPDGRLMTVPVPNKPATVNRFSAVLAHMIQKAVDWKMLDKWSVPKIRLMKEENRRLNYLSIEQVKALLDACNKEIRPIVIMALNTGMRRGELLGLTWDRVDLKHGFILLDKTKSGKRREIPINETLHELFRTLPRRLDVPFVFFNPETGKRYQDIGKAFEGACRRAKLVDFRFHDLRHTFASHLVMAGVDITTVKELLGHVDLKMTLRYAHLAPTHKVKAMAVLDSVINTKMPDSDNLTQANYHNFIIPAGVRGVERKVSSF